MCLLLASASPPEKSSLSSVEAFAPISRHACHFAHIAHRASVSDQNTPIEGGGDDEEDEDEQDLDMTAFQTRQKQQEEAKQQAETDSEEFDGYALRDVIYEKWGKCYDVDFNRVDSFGIRNLYLNVLPFHLGGRTFRHETEMDYLCHLQAVVEILEKYDQIGYVLAQIDDTKKKPRAGTSPLVAVPLRLDLTKEQVIEIIGY